MKEEEEEEKSQDKGDPELKRVHTPGRFSMRNKGPSHTADHSQAQARPPCSNGGNEAHANKEVQLLEGDASDVGVQITLPACARVQPTTGRTSEPMQWSVNSRPTHTVDLVKRILYKMCTCTSCRKESHRIQLSPFT